jgi:hypothetical protein
MVGRAKLSYRSMRVIPGGGRPETSGDGSEGREDVMELRLHICVEKFPNPITTSF